MAKATNKRPVLSVAFAVFSVLWMTNPPVAQGQTEKPGEESQDSITLRNKRELKGKISDFRKGSDVVLILADGQRMILRWNDISRIESSNPLLNYQAPKAEEAVDVVKTKDRKIFEGKIKELRRGEDIILVLPDGQQMVILWGDILEIESENPSLAYKNNPGITGNVEDKSDKNPKKEISSSGGIGISSESTLTSAEARRKAWLARGGPLPMFSMQISLQGILMPTTTTSIGSCSIESKGSGMGYGFSGRFGVMNLNLPKNKGSWWAFKMAAGLDLTMASISTEMTPVGNCPSTFPGGSSSSDMKYVQIPANIGFHVGLGPGKSDSWEGVVLGVSWAPSYSYIIPSSGEGSGNFNYYGLDFSLDFASLRSTLDKQAKKAHVRVNAFILPPISESSPAFFTAGLGAVWY